MGSDGRVAAIRAAAQDCAADRHDQDCSVQRHWVEHGFFQVGVPLDVAPKSHSSHVGYSRQA